MAFRPARGTSIACWRLEVPLDAEGIRWLGIDPRGGLAHVTFARLPADHALRALERICHPGVSTPIAWDEAPTPWVATPPPNGVPIDLDHLAEAPARGWLAFAMGLLDGLAAAHAAGVAFGQLRRHHLTMTLTSEPSVQLDGFAALLASPTGEPIPTPAADVLAAGRLLSALRSETDQPSAAACLDDVLGRMLTERSAQRPTAAEIVDRLLAVGARRKEPDAELLALRARDPRALRAALVAPVEHWLQRGGSLAILGPDGSGRTQAIDAIATRLSAAGLAWRTLDGHAPPAQWRALLAELDSSRTLPGTQSCLLVDGCDALEPDVQARLAQLVAQERLALCCAGRTAPVWIEERASLAPLQRAEIAALVRRTIGRSKDPSPLIDGAIRWTGGMPSRVNALVLGASRNGGLIYRDHRWEVDERGLTDLTTWLRTEPGVATLPPAARALAEALALHPSSASVETTAQVLGWHPAEVLAAADLLVGGGRLVHSDGGLACRDDDTRRRWRPPPERSGELHLRWMAALAALRPPPWRDMVPHLAATAHEPWVQPLVEPCVRALLAEVPAQAVSLLRDLSGPERPHPHPLLLAEALCAVGEPAGAVHVLQQVGPGAPPRQQIAAWCAAAMLGPPTAEPLQPPSPLHGLHPLLIQATGARLALLASRPALALERARPLPPTTPDLLDQRDAWLDLHTSRLQALLATGAVGEAREALFEVADLGRPAAARLLRVQAAVHLASGEHGRARDLLDRAAGRSVGLSAPERAEALVSCGEIAHQTGDRAGAVARWEAAAALLGPHQEALGARLSVRQCVGYRELARWDLAHEAGARAVARAGALALPEIEAEACCALLDLHLAQRLEEEAEAWFTRARALATRHSLKTVLLGLHRRRAEIAVRRDQVDALALCLTALDAAHAAGDELTASRACSLAAICFARKGQVHEAEEAISTALDTLNRLGDAEVLSYVRLTTASAWLTLGDHDRAMDQLRQVKVYAQEVGHVQLGRHASRLMRRAHETQEAARIKTPADRLLDLALATYRGANVASSLQLVVETLMHLLDADQAAVLRSDGESAEVLARTVRSEAQANPISSSVVSRCTTLRKEVLVGDVQERAALRDAKSIVAGAVASALCVPLLEGGEVVGVLYADSQRIRRQKMIELLPYVRAIAVHAAAVVATDQLRERARQQSAELNRLSKVKDELLATVSHELRTPLQAILGHADAAAQEPLTTTQRLAIEGIRTARDELLGSVDQLLDHARSGGTTVSDRPFHLRDVFDQLETRFRPLATAKGLELRVLPDPQALCRYEGALTALQQVLERLLDNAVRFTESGYVTLTARRPPDADHVVLVVSDTGPGIPTEHQARVFEPFALGAPAATRRQAGLGLGLATCRKLTDAVGGQIGLRSRPGRGTTVHVKFPLRVLPDPDTGRPELAAVADVPRRVLVVDDHPVNRRVFSQYVRNLEHEVEVVTGGADAVSAAGSQLFLAVLMDCHMPDVDGLEATRRIRKLPAPNGAVPIFAVTADTSEGFREVCLGAGMDDYVAKPLQPATLARLLEQARSSWSSGRAR
jgi:signal transduction histidine kinase/CheY-like chemotaxis protein